MPYSAASLSILCSVRDKGKFLLREDRSHGFQIRYHPATNKREDRSVLSLIPLERAGLIEFDSDPLDPKRYFSVRLTDKGLDYLNESDSKQCGEVAS